MTIDALRCAFNGSERHRQRRTADDSPQLEVGRLERHQVVGGRRDVQVTRLDAAAGDECE